MMSEALEASVARFARNFVRNSTEKSEKEYSNSSFHRKNTSIKNKQTPKRRNTKRASQASKRNKQKEQPQTTIIIIIEQRATASPEAH